MGRQHQRSYQKLQIKEGQTTPKELSEAANQRWTDNTKGVIRSCKSKMGRQHQRSYQKLQIKDGQTTLKG
jgi:hypothetical protein